MRPWKSVFTRKTLPPTPIRIFCSPSFYSGSRRSDIRTTSRLCPTLSSGIGISTSIAKASPLNKVSYVGINPPEEITAEGELNENEAKAVSAWREDLYGTHQELASKRLKRGWDPLQAEEQLLLHDGGSFEQRVSNLLKYDGGTDGQTLYPAALPWNA